MQNPDKDICYTTARPRKMEGKYNFRGRVDLVVAMKIIIRINTMWD